MKIDIPQPLPSDMPATRARDKEKGFWALNWLRYLLAIYIVLYHTLMGYGQIKGTWFQASLEIGNLATSVFFVLSGFLLTYAYVIVKSGREVNRRNFWVARFSTLYPLHLTGLLLSLLPFAQTMIGRGGIVVPLDLDGTATRMLGHGELIFGFLATATLMNAWNPLYILFNGPSWSLSALACFYLVFPFVAPGIYRINKPARMLIVLGVIFLLPGAIADLLHLTDIITDGVLHRNPIIRLPLFLAGMVLCVLHSRANVVGSPAQNAAGVIVVLATVAIAVTLQFMDSRLHVIKNGLYYPACLAIIWLCVSIKYKPSETIQYWGTRLGAASLPVFLLHMPFFPVFRAAEKFIKSLFYTPDWSISSIVATGRTIDQSVACYPLYLILLTILCVLVQERFVVPLQAKIRNAMSKRDRLEPVRETSKTGTV
ncbi:acyltransferase family protein [Pseudoduganella albidiflava]|uniref:Acyltransferase n=2 Tax=Pseudoduganella albidiflava TaxID=321983 RepID=A0ABX5RYY6_9BURK|nr:acyltransferase [Pseudoduganella albidiflava]QBI03035.1 acyltransferase [Pseudoduganella albidiflava]